MPPVRWKLLAVTTCLLQVVFIADAQIRHQDAMTSDGWRPILGTRQPNYFESSNPESSDIYKYEILSTPPPTATAQAPSVSTGPSQKPVFHVSPKPLNKPVRKIPHQKFFSQNPYFALPTHESHGPHIPLGAVIHSRPGQVGHIKQHATSSRPLINHHSTNGKRNKPIRIQTSTNGYRDDIFTASATSGSYSFYNHLPSNIRTRETVDLGLPNTNHFAINQPHSHLDFTNGFAFPPTRESVFQQYNNPPQPTYFFEKQPQSNDIFPFQNPNDDFTRDFIPPPQYYKPKEVPNKITKPKVPENVVLQVPPPFQFASQKVNDQVQVQVSKEKFHEFHNNIPENYNAQYVEYEFPVRQTTQAPKYDFSVRQTTQAPKPLYEVTEGKYEESPPPQRPQRTRPSGPPKQSPEISLNVPVFLPTPYKPEGQGIGPTSPTQSEVSTIFTKLSKIQREKATTPNPFAFDTKEVSTHYPVVGKPVFREPPQEISNEITTQSEEITTTTKEPTRVRPHRRRRPEHRRTTTTEPAVEVENYEPQKSEENETVETERPVRQRRPGRYRTTTPPNQSEEVSVSVKNNRGRNRYRHRNAETVNYEPIRKRRPSRVETTTIPDNHKIEEYYQSPETSSTEAEVAASEQSEEIEDSTKAETIELELPGRHYVTDPPKRIRYETIRPFIVITTTEKGPTTNLIVPENEVDPTSIPVEEITTTTTTTTTPTSATSHRIRGRPLKFDNSNRPRFSVKDYRHKLSQYSSTSTSTTPEPHRSTSESIRIRMPSRLRRPSTTTTTTPANNDEEENFEPVRSRFVPKETRHISTTEDSNVAIITEKNVKSVNTRLRPFGRTKSTTASTTSGPKVSIKPNLFNRKRPAMLSLRSRIYNKHKNNEETTTSRALTTEEMNEVSSTTTEYEEEVESQSTTASNWKRSNIKDDEDEIVEEIVNVETTTEGDLSKVDTNLYSQRVSDLTSSAKNDYNQFKSVSPTSRRIPNHFTLATDDPILPIEAFFTNIKDKVKDKDS